MFAIRFAAVTRAATVAAGLAAMTIAGAGTAGALTPDDALFLNTLDYVGIDYPSQGEALDVGHGICASFDDGYSFGEILDATQSLTGLGSGDAKVVMVAATAVYCEEYA